MEFDNKFIVPQKNLSGGLSLFWMNELDLHIRTFSSLNIDAIVNSRIDDAWRIMGFYRALEVAHWEDSWSLLRHLGSQFDMSWVMNYTARGKIKGPYPTKEAHARL